MYMRDYWLKFHVKTLKSKVYEFHQYAILPRQTNKNFTSKSFFK